MPEALEVEKETGEGKGIEEMDQLFNELAQTCKTFLSQQENFEKSRVLHIPWEGKTEANLAEMVFHLVTHAT